MRHRPVLSWRAGALAAVLSIGISLMLLQGTPGAHRPVAPSAARGGFARAGLLSLPAAARGPVSAALGAASPAYRVSGARGALVAENPAQHLSARFGAAGVSLRAGALRVAFGLRAIGYGGALTALAPVAPRTSGNRVVYSHPGLAEWYRNGPLGIEQGFTVLHAPQRAAGRLTLSMLVAGDAQAALTADGQALVLRRGGRALLGYGGLSATDASGRPLRSWLALREGHVLVNVETRGARYPLRIDPLIHEGEKLTASGLSGPYGYVGMSVALSADGNTALIGAPADGEYSGAAYVFTRTGASWSQQGAKLTGSDTVGEAWFGESVALSADGDTALIGGPSDDGALGAAWVFTRSGTTWTQQGEKLTGSGESGAGYFGRSVALSADGDTALIGGYNDDEHDGAAWAFTRSGTTWTQQGTKLTGSGNLGFFGWSVALSSSGTTALIGEWGVGGGVGAAFVFTRSGSSWSKQGEALTGPAGSGFSWFGYSVALSGDGDTALIGAPHADGYAGDASVFSRTGSTWSTQGAPLSGAGEDGEGELGYSAALSRDGDTALLGGRVDDGFHGAAWAFMRAGVVWAEDGEKLTGSAESANREEFGWSVALSSAGSTALVGSPCDKACVGSVSVFVSALEPPEFGSCRKVAGGAGSYANAGCTASGGKQDYAWEPGASASGFTISLSSGTASLETVGGTKLTCTGASGAGNYVGSKQIGGLVLTLNGCERAGTICSSAGASAGEIVSGALEGVLGVEKLGASASKDKLGLDLFGVGRTGSLMQFSCGAETVSLRGSVIAPVEANKMASTMTLKFKASRGRQKPAGFVGEPADVLEASFHGAPFEQAGLTLAGAASDEQALEINSVE